MSEPLLRIEIQDEKTIPKIYYKGEEVKPVMEASFEYESGEISEMSFLIKNHRKAFINDIVGMTKKYTSADKGE